MVDVIYLLKIQTAKHISVRSMRRIRLFITQLKITMCNLKITSTQLGMVNDKYLKWPI